jgi:hypothetical protein
MEKNKREQIEAKLREMILSADQPQHESRPARTKSMGARVIRRRKGSQDLKIR